MPDSLKKESLAAEFLRLSSELESLKEGNMEHTIVQTAKALREEIKSVPFQDN
jgi:hypothetical protein